MESRAFSLHHPVEDDWELLRDLRIRAIEDTPIAFLETLDTVRALREEDWRERARRNLRPESAQFVAVDDDGRWIGSLVCFVSQGLPSYVGRADGDAPRANIVGVFVDPEWRGGAGVTDALLDAACAWARDSHGLTSVHLHVSEANPRAQRAYEKRGFVPTGVIERIPDDPSGLDVEMVRAL